MDVWFTEAQYPGVNIVCKVLQTLYREVSPFQEILVLDTELFGRMLVLDGAIQVTVADEFAYHEMLAHVPICSHPAPGSVLIIGGGDGGCAREVLRHRQLQSITQVEIDRRVVEVCRQYLPELASSFDNPRLELRFEDGIEFVKNQEACYDVILVDAPDPVGVAAGLFRHDFYESIYRALRPDGIFAIQTESPFFNKDLISQVYQDVSSIFPIAELFLANVPTYPSGLWSFTLGSKRYDPARGPACLLGAENGAHAEDGARAEGGTGIGAGAQAEGGTGIGAGARAEGGTGIGAGARDGMGTYARAGMAAGAGSDSRTVVPPGLRYYTPEVHRAAFVLPPFVRSLLKG
jgi:spermidine synthase